MLVKYQFFLQEMVLHVSKDVPVNLLAKLLFELRCLFAFEYTLHTLMCMGHGIHVEDRG